MTQTTYYEFNKPEGTDLVNPLVDTNPNWDALDADLHEFNERSIANCTEVVALGVHTISRLDTTAKFLKWIATANYTAGETFTVDGLPVAATTPAGATLATNAYVTGSVVLACLNADNTAMTIFVSGTTVASDAERLGGELPSYYATQSDMSDAETDILNLQNQMGNTSIVGIGDGTATGAIRALNADLTDVAIASLSGTGSTSFTIPNSKRRLLCVVKDGTKVIESKDIPVSALSANDSVLLGNLKNIVGTSNIASDSTIDTNLVGLKLQGWKQASYNTQIQGIKVGGTKQTPTNDRTIGLSADLSESSGAELICNSSTSFTINITNSNLSVYIY